MALVISGKGRAAGMTRATAGPRRRPDPRSYSPVTPHEQEHDPWPVSPRPPVSPTSSRRSCPRSATFVDKEIIPHATALEHADEYPQEIVDGMKEMGLFGLTIPEEYGGLGESLLTYALVVEQIARGWMSVSGVINTHFIVALHAAPARHRRSRRRTTCPQMATGEITRLVLDVRARPRLRRRRDQDQGRGRRRRLRHRRRQDVADQRRHVHADRGAGQDRRGRREALPEPDDASWSRSPSATARSPPG